MALEKNKSKDMMGAEWHKVNCLVCKMISHCVAKDQKYIVMRKIVSGDLGLKLEDKYMTEHRDISSWIKSYFGSKTSQVILCLHILMVQQDNCWFAKFRCKNFKWR